MDRERAEAHLRMLAETELRRAAPHPAGSARVTRVAQALNAVGALESKTATRIVEDFELALTIRTAGPGGQRDLSRRPPAWLPGPASAPRPHTAPGRVVPLGTVIDVRTGDLSGQVSLLVRAAGRPRAAHRDRADLRRTRSRRGLVLPRVQRHG